MIREFLDNKLRITGAILGAFSIILVLNIILSGIVNISFIFPYIRTVYVVLISVILVIYLTSVFEKLRPVSRILKYSAITAAFLIILSLVFMYFWYNHCFFPDDEAYLGKKVSEVSYTNDALYEVDRDIIRELNKTAISSPLDQSDREFLLNPEFKTRDIYIDYNPYNSVSPNNLKYATGKTFFYIYQKNCAVIKGNSSVGINMAFSGNKRFIELDAVFPDLDGVASAGGDLLIYFIQGNGEKVTLASEKIKKEIKPDIQPFRFSSLFRSIWFYLTHPGVSVIPDDTGWKKIRADIPSAKGTLVIEFKTAGSGRDYLFAGTPRIYTEKSGSRNNHYNLVYIIFDTLGQPHIDLYEYFEEFLKNGYDEAVYTIGNNNIVTENIDRYYNSAVLFDNVITAGQVTRPSIVALWTSQLYTRARMPVYRNVVTAENQREFYDMGFTTLGEKLSGYGYLTEQIACNAEGHNVSGVGADLGFDENHDYTMEASEYSANIKNIVDFLNENQNRKFFLYTHLNIPHPPQWVPMKYPLKEMKFSKYNYAVTRLRANIRYADFNFKIIMDAIKKLKLDDNTFVIITADHSTGELPGFREKPGKQLEAVIKNGRDSILTATFHPKAIYTRGGGEHLNNEYMKIPFIVIPPKSFKIKKRRIGSYISSLDISPTILDLFRGEKEKLFSGSSFKYLLEKPELEKKVHTEFIPMVGRFSNGFILNGRYKYWWDVTGMYKYRTGTDGTRYIQHPEHLYDLDSDPYETENLANIDKYAPLLNEMRDIRNVRYQDYDSKNYIQLMPDDKIKGSIRIDITAASGKLVYPSVFGENLNISRKSDRDFEVSSLNSGKYRSISFETKPDRVPLKITLYRGNDLIDKLTVYSGMEKLNMFSNPLMINDWKDFFVTTISGRTGLEEADLPQGSVYFYRIPVNYWQEMSRSENDINLSPGIKEVLRGWGYIQ